MHYCHSSDRDNLLAFGECGAKAFDNQDWQKAVQMKLAIENWSVFQTEADRFCMNAFHPKSLNNYLRSYYEFNRFKKASSAVMLTAGIILLL